MSNRQARRVTRHLAQVGYREKLGLTQQRIINFWSPECGADPRRAETLYLERLLDGHAPAAHERVLDAGCGPGGTALWLARLYGCAVDGVDLFAPYVELARAQAAREGLSGRVQVRRADLTRDALPRAAYDLALSVAVGYLIEDKRAYLGNLLGALRPGGRLLVADHFLEAGVRALDRRVMSAIVSSRHMRPLAHLRALIAEQGGEVVDCRDVTGATIVASLDWLESHAPVKDLLLGRRTPQRLVYWLTKRSFQRAARGGHWRMHFLSVRRR